MGDINFLFRFTGLQALNKSVCLRFRRLIYIFLGLSCFAALSACGASQDLNFYARVTVEATYNGRPVSGSGVILQPYINSSPAGLTRGEAIPIDLGGGKYIYMPLVDRGNHTRVYASAISKTFQYIYSPDKKPLPREERLKLLFDIPYGTKADWPYKWEKKKPDPRGKYTGYPLLVGFNNQEIPCSNFIVETERPDRVFGGVFNFERITIERVPPNTSLTTDIAKKLPWVESSASFWSGRASLRLCGEGDEKYKDIPNRDKRLKRTHFIGPRG